MVNQIKQLTLFTFAIALLGSFNNKKDKQELNWLDWNTGYLQAKKENKIILVDAYTDWCGWCKKMDKDTYTNQEIIKTLNKDFVVIKFNPEISDVTYDLEGKKLTGRELLAQLSQGKATGFPTTYFIQPNKRQIRLAAGYLDPIDFKKVLEQALEMK